MIGDCPNPHSPIPIDIVKLIYYFNNLLNCNKSLEEEDSDSDYESDEVK